MSSTFNRRDFSLYLTTFLPALGAAGPALASPAANDAGISGNNEAIHQEVTFNANPKRVYDALTDAKHFNKVMQMSEALISGMVKSKDSAKISRKPGGAFALFGGYITGMQIELVPNTRIVQVWRAASWPEGAYSIASYALSAQGSGTKLVFDHTGFPNGQAEHLAHGWHANYWDPLTKFLA
jgi:activator of HSP90 ATPase